MGGKSKALKEGFSLIDDFISAIKSADKTPIVPAPNRWFAKPDEYPHVQPMVERALASSGMGRQDFPFGAYIDPRTGEVLTNRMMDEVGVLIDPKTGRPMMSGKPSGMESFEDLSKALGSQTQSNLVRRSLFKPTGGDPLLGQIPFVATVERGPHFYGLGTEYASPAQLFQVERGSNPHLRPKSRGDVFGMGEVVGQMRIGQGPEHDVYEKLLVAPKGSDVPGKKLSKAKGGEVRMMGGGNPRPSKRPLSEALLGLGDVIAGATRGGVKEFLGTPGDLEALVRERGLGLPANVLRLLMPTRSGKETTLPTSEDFDEYLPPVVPKGAENYDERARTAGIAQSLGEFNPVVPLSYAAAAKGAVKGAKAAGKGALSLAKSEPARRAVERAAQMTGAAPMNIVKNKGGDWIDTGLTPITRRIEIDKAEDIERNLNETRDLYDKALRERGAGDYWTRYYADNLKMLEANLAERRFADKNLVNYMRNQMGTEDDPIRKAIDQGYYHFDLPEYNLFPNQEKQLENKRLSLGFPPKGLATTPQGKEWEFITDMAINPEPAAYRIENDIGSFEGSLLERNPWLAKVPPDRQVYSINRHTRPMDLGFDELLKTLNEEVLAGRIDPMNVKTIKMDDLVRLTHKRELERQAAMRQALASSRKDLPVFKEYPEGYKWVELNKPGSFATESDAMQHSVRGYEPEKGDPDWVDLSGNSGQAGYGHGGWEAIKSGRAKVYSLVDSEGTPHVTIETLKPNDEINFDKTVDLIEELRTTLGREPTDQEFQKAAESLWSQAQPYKITQIKRKSNIVDRDDYPQRKYVQDFVRSGGFGEITQDLENTGFVKRGNAFTPAEKQYLIERGHSVPEYLTPEEVQTLRPMLRAVPESYFQKPPPSTPEPELDIGDNWLEDLYGGQKKGGLIALRKGHGKG